MALTKRETTLIKDTQIVLVWDRYIGMATFVKTYTFLFYANQRKNKFACSAVAITQMAAERWSGDPRHSQVTLESTGGESLLLTEK